MTSRTISGTIAAYRVGARVRRLMATGMTRAQATAAAAPIHPVVRALFNPTSHYGFFILVGLVLVALQQVTRMGAAISLSLDAEPENRRQIASIGGGVWSVLTAKMAATAVTVLPVAYIAIRLPFDLFGSAFRGNWLLAFALLTLFMLMQIFVGYGISGLCGSAVFSLQVLLYASVPLFTLAGFTWPAYAMPVWAQAVRWLIPLAHITDVFRKMALMGAGARSLWPHLTALLVWLPISVLWGYWGLRRQIAAQK